MCMYVCVYVCICTCMYVPYVCVCMYVCMHACMYVCILYVCMHVCVCVCMYVGVYVWVCKCVCMYVCMYDVHMYDLYIWVLVWVGVHVCYVGPYKWICGCMGECMGGWLKYLLTRQLVCLLAPFSPILLVLPPTLRSFQRQAAMAASLESIFAWPGCRREVNIEKFGDYLGATIEALLVQQRKLLIKVGKHLV